MFMIRAFCVGILLLAGVSVAEEKQYYQPDPEKHSALEAQRCASYKKQVVLIKRRLTGPVNIKSDIKRMHDKLESLERSIAQYCPAEAAK